MHCGNKLSFSRTYMGYIVCSTVPTARIYLEIRRRTMWAFDSHAVILD
jgi:hypothetical protein